MIKLCMAIFIMSIIFLFIGISIIKYQVEGDKTMPFNLSKIVMISTAEGVETEGKEKWNFNIYQNNDLYFYITENENQKDDTIYIEKIRIENIKILEEPKVGNIKAYMPNSLEGRLYTYDESFIVEEKLEYKGGAKSDPKILQIGNQGGNILIRFSNTKLGNYSSNNDTEIVHDGTLLKKLNLEEKDIKFEVSFDIVIEDSKHKYRANIKLELPHEGLIENGTSSIEKTDFSDVIFKRE